MKLKRGDLVIVRNPDFPTRLLGVHLVEKVQDGFSFDRSFNPAGLRGGYSDDLWIVIGNVRDLTELEKIIYGIGIQE